MTTPNAAPLKLSEGNWWAEIASYAGKLNWALSLVGMLRALITATQQNQITPEASSGLIKAVQQDLSAGISIGDRHYVIAVVVPNSDATGRRRQFFILLPHYPESTIKRIEEV